VRQTIEERYPSLGAESRVAHRRGGRSKTELFVTRYTVEERQARADVHSPAARMRRDLQRHLGFRRVWLALIAARLPLVGHNCMFDLLFLYAAFEGELPDTLPDFKRELHARFPVIIDTKVLANHAVLNGDKLRLGSPFRAALVGELGSAAADVASSAVPICRDEDCKQDIEALAMAENALLSSESIVSSLESSSAEPIRSGRGGRGGRSGMAHHQSRRTNHANAKGLEATASVPARVSDTSLGSLFQQCKAEDAAAHSSDQSAPTAAEATSTTVSEALAFSSRVRFGAGFAQYGGGASARLHEAGFDAFATGFVLLHLGGEIVRFHERLRSSAAPSARPLQSPALWKYAGIPAHSDEQCTSWYPRLEQAVATFLSASSAQPPLSPPADEHVAACFDVHHPAMRACANYLFLLKSPFLLDLAGVRSLTGSAADAGDDENEPRIDDCPEYVLSNASPLTQSPDVARLFGVASNQLWVQWLDKQSALVSFRKFCVVATDAESAALRARARDEQSAPTTEMRVWTLMGHIRMEAAAAAAVSSSASASDALASHDPKPSLPSVLHCTIGGRDEQVTLRMDFPPPAASDAFVCSLLNDAAAVAHLPPLQRAWTLEDIAARREFHAAAIARQAGWFGVMRIGGGTPNGEADGHDASAAEWVGICGLRAIDWATRVAEFGVLIAPAFQRRGLCAAAVRECLSVAFDALGMRRVVLRTAVANAPMRQCCVRFGMRCDGEIRLDDGSEFVQYTVEAAQHRSS
jgi:RimJ/RimL family protein N-acetyltransferase